MKIIVTAFLGPLGVLADGRLWVVAVLPACEGAVLPRIQTE